MSLSEQLAKLGHPEPEFVDIDEDVYDDTTARNILQDKDEEIDAKTIDFGLSAIRKKLPLEEIDPKYFGQRISREKLNDDDFCDDVINGENDPDDSVGDDLSDKDESGDQSDDVTEESMTESESAEEEIKVSKPTKKIQNLSVIKESDEIQKGISTQNQLVLWDALLETRIKLQKIVAAANRLPQLAHFTEFSRQCSDDVIIARNRIVELIEKLVYLQDLLKYRCEETKTLVDVNSRERRLDNEKDVILGKRKLEAEDIHETLREEHEILRSFRDKTIQKWHHKTRMSMGKVGKQNHHQGPLKQIEQIVSDRERLVQRTQVKRSKYHILGKKDLDEERQNEENILDSKSEIRDTEIFDDDDFYHNLLRELIERKTSALSDPTAITKHRLEIQRLRAKTKKTVDTKASKGRKIRHNVHQKLVNFMAPTEKPKWTDSACDELFSSLFRGKNISQTISTAQ